MVAVGFAELRFAHTFVVVRTLLDWRGINRSRCSAYIYSYAAPSGNLYNVQTANCVCVCVFMFIAAHVLTRLNAMKYVCLPEVLYI